MAARDLGPPETGGDRRCTRHERELEMRRLTYEFYDQLDCVDVNGSSSEYAEWAEGAD